MVERADGRRIARKMKTKNKLPVAGCRLKAAGRVTSCAPSAVRRLAALPICFKSKIENQKSKMASRSSNCSWSSPSSPCWPPSRSRSCPRSRDASISARPRGKWGSWRRPLTATRRLRILSAGQSQTAGANGTMVRPLYYELLGTTNITTAPIKRWMTASNRGFRAGGVHISAGRGRICELQQTQRGRGSPASQKFHPGYEAEPDGLHISNDIDTAVSGSQSSSARSAGRT